MNADLYRVAFAVAFAIARHVAVEKGSPNEPALHRDDPSWTPLQSLGHAQHHTPTLRRTQTNPARPRRPRG